MEKNKMEQRLNDILNAFERNLVASFKGERSDYNLKNDYIDLKYDFMKLLLEATHKDIARSMHPKRDIHDMFVAELNNRTVRHTMDQLMLHGSRKSSNSSESVGAHLNDDTPES